MTRDIASDFAAGSWEFTPGVADVFDEHVRASVPHYDVIQTLVIEASDWLLPSGGTLVDLGASTGTTAAAILARHPERRLNAWLYDDSDPMLKRAAAKIGDNLRVHYRLDRIERRGALDSYDKADLTLSLFTLQFLSLDSRLATLRNARARAADSGALLVAEKLRLSDPRWVEIATDLSHDWKAEHGISDEAIRAKSRSLRGVLRPHSLDTLLRTIEAAGWTRPEVIFRWHQWCLVGAFATTDG